MVEGHNLVFRAPPSTDGSAGTEVRAQVSISSCNMPGTSYHLDTIRAISKLASVTLVYST